MAPLYICSIFKFCKILRHLTLSILVNLKLGLHKLSEEKKIWKNSKGFGFYDHFCGSKFQKNSIFWKISFFIELQKYKGKMGFMWKIHIFVIKYQQLNNILCKKKLIIHFDGILKIVSKLLNKP